eukprot:1180543-Prorocentrum_minimum.AAC.1
MRGSLAGSVVASLPPLPSRFILLSNDIHHRHELHLVCRDHLGRHDRSELDGLLRHPVIGHRGRPCPAGVSGGCCLPRGYWGN